MLCFFCEFFFVIPFCFATVPPDGLFEQIIQVFLVIGIQLVEVVFDINIQMAWLRDSLDPGVFVIKLVPYVVCGKFNVSAGEDIPIPT